MPDLTTAQREKIRQAIGDPGSILPRGDNRTEPITRWSARAVETVLADVLAERERTARASALAPVQALMQRWRDTGTAGDGFTLTSVLSQVQATVSTGGVTAEEVEASRDPLAVGTRVQVTNPSLAFHGDVGTVVVAEVDCYVHLDGDPRGPRAFRRTSLTAMDAATGQAPGA